MLYIYRNIFMNIEVYILQNFNGNIKQQCIDDTKVADLYTNSIDRVRKFHHRFAPGVLIKIFIFLKYVLFFFHERGRPVFAALPPYSTVLNITSF